MPDTVRTDAEILALLADNTSGNISAQDMRDAYVSLLDRIDKADLPTAFTFTDITGATHLSIHNHATITVAGIKVPAVARAGGALTFSVNGGAFVTEAVVQLGDEITPRMTASSENLTEVTGTLSIGATSDTWSITTGNFWTPGLDPEFLAYGWFQEDLVTPGAITEWVSRGVKTKTLTGTATKIADNGGVFLAGGSSAANLQCPVETDQPNLVRWWAVVFKGTQPTGSNSSRVVAFHGTLQNQGSRQPLVMIGGPTATFPGVLLAAFDTEARAFNEPVDEDDWNIVVGWRRAWKIGATINGVQKTPVEFKGWQAQNISTPLWFGAGGQTPGDTALSADVYIAEAFFGQSEVSDAFLRKVEGYAHWKYGREDLLDAGHPYKSAAPTPDGSEGVATRFAFDQTAWNTWIAITDGTKQVNMGGTPPGLDEGSEGSPGVDDYSVVFFDDFLADSVVNKLTGAPTSIWFGGMQNTAVSDAATLLDKGTSPNCYVHDGTGTGTMTLRLQESVSGNGAWRAGAITTVNQNGLGRHWFTKGRIRVRARHPAFSPPTEANVPGLFTGPIWCYHIDYLRWRTRNRLEFDIVEVDDAGNFYNGGATHIHEPTVLSSIAGVRQTGVSDKIFGEFLNPAHNFDPEINVYDGEFHTWEARIEDDFTYLIVDDKEAARVATVPWLTVPKMLNITIAYRTFEGTLTPGEIYDLDIDWVEVQMRERDLAVVPTGFSGRPTLSGTRGSGNTITVTPNTTASQIEYRWYKDGEPIVGEAAATFVEDADSETKALRVHVRAISLLDQPEAWTAALAPAGSP